MQRAYRLFVALVLISSFAHAQNHPQQKTEEDSLKFYHSIEKAAMKHKLTGMVYKAVFNLPDERSKDVLKKQKPFTKYRGKIIREIIVETVDPFGYDIRDTTAIPHSIIQRGGNFLHNRSSVGTIKNQLLIHKNQPLDLLKLKESERLLRQSVYVKDVVVDVQRVKGTDSVDVIFREQDLWSIAVGVGVVGSKKTFLFKDKNFLGLSHQLDNSLFYFSDQNKYILQGSYTVPYIRNTYITATGYYNTSNEIYLKGISTNRPFFSSLTKWAGGLDYLFHGSTDSVRSPESPSVGYHIRYRDLDVWSGRSFPLSLSKSDEARSTRLITSLRFLDRKYSEVPPLSVDSMHLYVNSYFYLGAIGISNRTYYRDLYIYRYGIPEDVPSGRMGQILFGYEDGAYTGRLYTGAQAGYGDHLYHFGYLSGLIGYGTFLHEGHPEQSVLNTSLGYFSDLLSLNNWRYRQFIKSQVVYGFNRKPGEAVNINNDNGIKGFESESLNGTNKIVVTLQSQLYLPYHVIGFRFAPFVFLNFGMLGDNHASFLNGRLYQGYGLGLLVKNELLTINTFQFSFGFYPFIPGTGNSISKFSPVKTYDFTFRDFDIEKPLPVAFE